MVNNRAKMQRSNSKARAWLESTGYKNIYFFPHSRFSKDYHIDCENQTADFDGVAHDDYSVLFFQVKSNCRAPKRVLLHYKDIEEQLGIRCMWLNAVDRKPLECNNESVL